MLYIRLVSILSVLDKLGYVPVPSKAEHIVSESIKKSFVSLFGQAATTIVLDNLCSLYGLSEKELTTNYDIFEKSLYNISSYGASIILGYIKKEILIAAVASFLDSEITEQDITNPDISIRDIIKKISSNEVSKFVCQITACMHIVFIYENESTKYKVLSAFFGESCSQDTKYVGSSQISSSTKALISTKQTKLFNINNILYYEDLLDDTEKSQVTKEVSDWINSFNYNGNFNVSRKGHNEEIDVRRDKDYSIAGSPPPPPLTHPNIRIAIEDASWIVLNGFRHEFIYLEETIAKNIGNSKSMSIICTYNLPDISEDGIYKEMIMRIIEAHSYVILEEPLVVYRATTKS